MARASLRRPWRWSSYLAGGWHSYRPRPHRPLPTQRRHRAGGVRAGEWRVGRGGWGGGPQDAHDVVPRLHTFAPTVVLRGVGIVPSSLRRCGTFLVHVAGEEAEHHQKSWHTLYDSPSMSSPPSPSSLVLKDRPILLTLPDLVDVGALCPLTQLLLGVGHLDELVDLGVEGRRHAGHELTRHRDVRAARLDHCGEGWRWREGGWRGFGIRRRERGGDRGEGTTYTTSSRRIATSSLWPDSTDGSVGTPKGVRTTMWGAYTCVRAACASSCTPFRVCACKKNREFADRWWGYRRP